MSESDELDLMSQVARLHYLEGLTRIEIAQQLSVSRFKVARLLETALKTGVVTITIRPAGLVDLELSAALVERYGLQEATAVHVGSPDPAELYNRLGQVTARLLADTVTQDDVLGFDCGRTVSHIADHLTSLPACDVVQLSGLAGAVQQTGLDILRRVSQTSGGAAFPLYAPMIAVDARSAVALREEPGIQATMQRYQDVTTAIVSVGSWAPPVSQVYDQLAPREQQTFLEAGVVAETCALMFGSDGKPVKGLDDRRIGIPLTALQAVPRVIAVAGGVAKTHAIRALLASGLLNALVTDELTARALLEQQAV